MTTTPDVLDVLRRHLDELAELRDDLDPFELGVVSAVEDSIELAVTMIGEARP